MREKWEKTVTEMAILRRCRKITTLKDLDAISDDKDRRESAHGQKWWWVVSTLLIYKPTRANFQHRNFFYAENASHSNFLGETFKFWQRAIQV